MCSQTQSTQQGRIVPSKQTRCFSALKATDQKTLYVRGGVRTRHKRSFQASIFFSKKSGFLFPEDGSIAEPLLSGGSGYFYKNL